MHNAKERLYDYLIEGANKWVAMKDYRASSYSTCDRYRDEVRSRIIERKYEHTEVSEDISVFSTEETYVYAPSHLIHKYVVFSLYHHKGTQNPDELQSIIDELRKKDIETKEARLKLKGLK